MEQHEEWLEGHRYSNIDYWREQKKAMRLKMVAQELCSGTIVQLALLRRKEGSERGQEASNLFAELAKFVSVL